MPESAFMHYGQYIMAGILITNYLPRFNAINSEDKRYGWGEPNGYLYQKEYLEFFIDARYLERLKSILAGTKCVSYHVTNRDGSVRHTNWPLHHPITLCWGLFPSKCSQYDEASDFAHFFLFQSVTFPYRTRIP